MIKIEYTEKAIRDIEALNSELSQRIIEKIYYYSCQENPLDFAKGLQGKYQGCFRFRIGEYRAIFSVNQNGEIKVFFILRIKHRKDAYR